MDLTGVRDNGFGVDLESVVLTSEDELGMTSISGSKQQAKALVAKFCGGFVDGLIKAEDGMSCGNESNVKGVSPESVKVATNKMFDGDETAGSAEKASSEKEKQKKSSNHKPPKPPRPTMPK